MVWVTMASATAMYWLISVAAAYYFGESVSVYFPMLWFGVVSVVMVVLREAVAFSSLVSLLFRCSFSDFGDKQARGRPPSQEHMLGSPSDISPCALILRGVTDGYCLPSFSSLSPTNYTAQRQPKKTPEKIHSSFSERRVVGLKLMYT